MKRWICYCWQKHSNLFTVEKKYIKPSTNGLRLFLFFPLDGTNTIFCSITISSIHSYSHLACKSLINYVVAVLSVDPPPPLSPAHPISKQFDHMDMENIIKITIRFSIFNVQCLFLFSFDKHEWNNKWYFITMKTFIRFFSLFIFFAFLSTNTVPSPLTSNHFFNLRIFHCLFCFDFLFGYDLHFTTYTI